MAKYISPLDHLANHDCTRCELHETTERVCVMGRGSATAKVMIIGEAPGGNEELTGRVFSGAAGRLLDQALAAAGFDEGEYYITNVVKCRPPDNRKPDRDEWEACDRYLRREIKALSPRHVLLLGNTALQSVWGRSGITKNRGVRLSGAKHPNLAGVELMATIHPAYCLRNPGQLPLFMEDVRRFRRLVTGTLEVKEVKTRFAATTRAVQYVAKRIREAEVVAYDVETRYMPWHGKEWAIVCLGVAVSPAEAYVIPLRHPDSPLRKKWKRVLLEHIRPAFKYTTAKLVAQNGKFDNIQLRGAGVAVEHDFDIMLAAHLLDENRPKNLGFLAQTLLGADVYKGMIDLKPEKIMESDLRQLAIYNGNDCGYTHQLYPKLKEELVQHPRLKRLFVKLMMPASHMMQQVEYRGMYVNQERLLERIDRLQYMIDEQKEVLYEHLPEKHFDTEEFNFNSPQQLGRWLFSSEKKGGLGLSPLERTPTGNPSTREGVLLHYREHPAIAALLKYRTLQLKWMNTYLLPWSERLDERSRLHTTYKLYGTVTGRLSGDMQQVPRHPFIRSVFGAPPGWQWIQADYSQIELRIVAHIAQERRMIRAFLTGEDLHSITASRLTGQPVDYFTSANTFQAKEQRKLAKAVNFGFVYGMYPRKFQTYAFENYNLKTTIEEASLARKQFFETFPDLRAWHDRQERLVRSRGWVQSPLGRVRHLPDILSGDGGVQQEAVRQAINSPVQATASDCMLFGMVCLHQQLDPRECFMVGTLHDGIFFECREDKVEKWTAVIKDTLENLPLKKNFGTDLSVPIVADVEWGQHWGEPEASLK